MHSFHIVILFFFFFFFQAEDGIRYLTVTGVQTCALPIFALLGGQSKLRQEDRRIRSVMRGAAQLMLFYGVYLLGFFRRFAERADTVATGSLVLPLGALVLGSAGVVLGWNRLAPEVP